MSMCWSIAKQDDMHETVVLTTLQCAAFYEGLSTHRIASQHTAMAFAVLVPALPLSLSSVCSLMKI